MLHRDISVSLTDIANRCGTDKGSLFNGYTIVYEMFFASKRNDPVNLLEIGLAMGGPELGHSADRKVTDAPSIKMWHEFFPHAKIYGLDISDFSSFETDWFKFFRADCGNVSELRAVADRGIEFDFIIDDGSHASFHQQLTFAELFQCLRPGGLYIIEDLNWQPVEYETSLPRVPKTSDLLLQISRGKVGDSRSPIDEVLARDIASIVIFDEDRLIEMRHRENLFSGINPTMKHYADRTTKGLSFARSHVRRIGEALAVFIKSLTGIQSSPQRAKLAVIQKRIA
jgi:SAM-dependent methyltransferase